MTALGNDRWRGDVRRAGRSAAIATRSAPGSIAFLSWRARFRAPRRCRRHARRGARSARSSSRPRPRARAGADAQAAERIGRATLRDGEPTSTRCAHRARRGAAARSRSAIPTGASRRAYAGRVSARRRPRARRVLDAGTSSFRARPRQRRARTARSRDCEARLAVRRARWASTSLYLPPIHPIGREHRKGTNNALVAEPDDVGSPWAIGAAEGGHKAIHPQLGTLDDFRRLVASARERRHRDRARHRVPVRARPSVRDAASGVVPAAARRQRPVRRESAEEIPGHLSVRLRVRRLARAVGGAARASSTFWIGEGVRIFRVDNPHTKPFAFWEWVIARVQARASGRDLPRRGVHAAEGDAPAREARLHPVVHVLHLAQHQARADRVLHRAARRVRARVLPAELLAEHARHPARVPADRRPPGVHRARCVLAATLAANYGIYGPAFELLEHAPREPGSEEYLDSEKYELRHWDLERPDSLRAAHRARERDRAATIRALQHDGACVPRHRQRAAASAIRSRRGASRTRSLVVVNLDPHHAQIGLGRRSTSRRSASSPTQPFQVHDLLTDARYRLARARATSCSSIRRACRRTCSACAGACATSATSTTSYRRPPLGRPCHRSRCRTGRDAAATTPLWYKDAVIYQLHVKAFFDSNDDGIGDFRGLTEKLDYIQDLGVNTIWLLPFYPSPLRDDGYDVADYHNVHPHYGTRDDFQHFVREAHRRGLQVITELVVNHTSDQHPWFQAARRAPPGSRKRDYYVWSDDPNEVRAARASSSPTPRPRTGPGTRSRKQYYWHRFFSHQPDLNFDNPQVLKAVLARHALLARHGRRRLPARRDSVPRRARGHEQREPARDARGAEADPRAASTRSYPNVLLLAEANQWPEDVREYFGDGDECHMAYHFPLMPRMYMAIAQEDRHPIVEIMQQTPDIPANCQWAIFLRNHDELTLEMVTEPRARLHVPHVRRRPARAHQPRHPPAPRAADGERPRRASS